MPYSFASMYSQYKELRVLSMCHNSWRMKFGGRRKWSWISLYEIISRRWILRNLYNIEKSKVKWYWDREEWEGNGKGGGCSLLCKQFKFFVLGMLSLHSFAYRWMQSKIKQLKDLDNNSHITVLNYNIHAPLIHTLKRTQVTKEQR